MGIEIMRRWPMYIVFAVGVLSLLSLFSSWNTWNTETELQYKVSELSIHLKACSVHQTSCMEKSLTIIQERDDYLREVNQLKNAITKLNNDVAQYKSKLSKSESQVNHTMVDVEICQAELQSLKNLQVSKTAIVETLRLEKDTLATQLTERKLKIDELEKEIVRLKSAPTNKSSPTPAPPPVKISLGGPEEPVLNAALAAKDPINEPVLANDAKEEFEENGVNDSNDFDPQIK